MTSALAASLGVWVFASGWEDSGEMRSLCERFSSDKGALDRMYVLPESMKRYDRFEIFYTNWLNALGKVDFEKLPNGGRADWVVLKNRCEYELSDIALERQKLQETKKLLPFWDDLVDLVHSRVLKSVPPAESAADAVARLEKSVKLATQASAKASVKEPVARRALEMLGRGKDRLREWFDYYDGYDPLFSWWVRNPYAQLDKALDGLRAQIDKTYFDGQANAETAIKGDPIGEEGFNVELRHEMISYSVGELIDIGKKELAWCDEELKKASRELGYGDNWHKALEHVKNLHAEPGGQTTVVNELAEEAIDWVEKNDLLSVPDLAKETWRMVMMSPQRQLVSPFFLGGETIMVSFPTDEMTHEQKLMSMRANNRYFSKATVHHELIPGHHMQQYMTSRFNTHRQGISYTPFWVEGWALYWEFLMYQRGFAGTPEERIGFLFWRKHRAARIVFSLSFHLGKMTAQQCVDMLVDEVGHERSTAEGEVRRSLGGTYPPLYQAAYMLGAFQLWDIRRDVVDSGKMTEKEFHDAVLQIGNLPWAVVKSLLEQKPIGKDFSFDWSFYRGSVGRN